MQKSVRWGAADSAAHSSGVRIARREAGAGAVGSSDHLCAAAEGGHDARLGMLSQAVAVTTREGHIAGSETKGLASGAPLSGRGISAQGAASGGSASSRQSIG